MNSRPAPAPTPPPLAEGWELQIPRPWKRARGGGWEPVPWLTLNNRLINTGYAAALAKKWRLAAYEAAQIARLPRGLDRIHLTVEIRKLTNHKKDQGNHEPTLKAIIDGAIGPTKPAYLRGGKWVPEQKGWGVVPDDNLDHVVREAEQFGPPLGVKNPVKGLVILYITPLPPAASR